MKKEYLIIGKEPVTLLNDEPRGPVSAYVRKGSIHTVDSDWLVPVEEVGTEPPVPPAHRKEDRPTSVKGALLDVNRGTQRHKLLTAYGFHSLGLTDEEAARATGLEAACYWKRCGELRAQGYIADTGDVRKGAAGTERIVCQATPDGLARLRQLEREQV